MIKQDYYLCDIFKGLKTIRNVLGSGNNLINVIMEPYKSKEIIEMFIEENKHKSILYLSFKKSKLDSNLACDTLLFDSFMNITKVYDFVIIDDISFYSNYNISALIELANSIYKNTKNIIIFAIDIIFENTANIFITTQTKETHFKEPRVIVSRFDLRRTIPSIFYSYLEWFYHNGENVLIYVEKEKEQGIYGKFIEFKKEFIDMNVILFKGNTNNLLTQLDKNKKTIIINSNIQGIIDNIRNTNVILYNDSKKFFYYKEIVFLCGRYSTLTEKKELILLSKKESINIDRARGKARLYNQIAWGDEK